MVFGLSNRRRTDTDQGLEPTRLRDLILRDAVGVACVLLAAGAALAGPLLHGIHLGPYDLLSAYGLSQVRGVVPHNLISSDQIKLFIPWANLEWTQVHQGHLPLWNPYSALGMPLAFNWESAPFSIPALIAYLGPLSLVYTVQVMTALVLAGTGAYVLARLLGLGTLGCVFAGVVYELCGPFVSWLGWPVASVMSLAPWLFAAAVLILRGTHRVQAVSFFALVLAFAIYAGQPEMVVVLAVSLAVFLIVSLAKRRPGHDRRGGLARPIVDFAMATAAGLGLAAPLVLPGLQIANLSVRSVGTTFPWDRHALPADNLIHLIAQGFHGLPITGSTWFGDLNFYETDVYVGVIALVLAAVGVALEWQRTEVASFGVVALVTGAIVFAAPVMSFADSLPGIGNVLWHRALAPLGLAIAVLAGVGMDRLVRRHREPRVRILAGGGFVAAGIWIALVWGLRSGHLPFNQSSIQARSLVGPTTEVFVGIAVVAGLTVVHARPLTNHVAVIVRKFAGPLGGGALLLCGSAFLVASVPAVWSSAKTTRPTAAAVALKRIVGSSVVGLGDEASVGTLGLLPNTNGLLGVQELSVYDPMTPLAYFSSWRMATGRTGGDAAIEIFSPAVTAAADARRFGVEFILDAPGVPGPTGAKFVTTLGGEGLYRVPGVGLATLTPDTSHLRSIPNDAPGRPLGVDRSDPAVWKIVTNSATAGALRLRLTALPGWVATLDGRPLALRRFSGVMLEARVPKGRHAVELRYWPTTFTAGIALAVLCAAGLSGALAFSSLNRHRRDPPT